jgi:hypothetical protein
MFREINVTEINFTNEHHQNSEENEIKMVSKLYILLPRHRSSAMGSEERPSPPKEAQVAM